jgi:hypothetical protein
MESPTGMIVVASEGTVVNVVATEGAMVDVAVLGVSKSLPAQAATMSPSDKIAAAHPRAARRREVSDRFLRIGTSW